jgi:hypothetical protein
MTKSLSVVALSMLIKLLNQHLYVRAIHMALAAEGFQASKCIVHNKLKDTISKGIHSVQNTAFVMPQAEPLRRKVYRYVYSKAQRTQRDVDP